MRPIVLLFLLIYIPIHARAQCCSGGSGSPLAGGTSQGVLQERQLEVNTNFQYIKTNQFYTGDKKDTVKYFEYYSSSYQYFRLAYGITRNLTMSVETGYYFNKEEKGLEGSTTGTYASSGISDLILFPRYDIVNRTTESGRTEVTVGIGNKIPLGSHDDSTRFVIPPVNTEIYVTKPQSVQLSSGAQDIIFYGFFYRGFKDNKFKVFANGIYIKKGWNSLGEKLGDYSSAALFAGRSFFNKLGVTLQVRWEEVKKMQLNENIMLYAYPNYDPEATGYTKIFVSPQISFSWKKFTLYGLYDVPVYQKMVKSQVGSETQFTTGLSYRFYALKSKVE